MCDDEVTKPRHADAGPNGGLAEPSHADAVLLKGEPSKAGLDDGTALAGGGNGKTSQQLSAENNRPGQGMTQSLAPQGEVVAQSETSLSKSGEAPKSPPAGPAANIEAPASQTEPPGDVAGPIPAG